ncbi:Na+/H+-dicarboxylate symporter [Succiniclasticum ruminis]|jgi:Na+/H+-dicarboxylate symporter|uniref:Na+/H+-dicarboxylate symporter n=1 Tax=Succiniclasticum ruminis TaxID=40841 RepID=A0A1G6MEH2_9FIRM|nr:dicarboxylate/amino acid:cation symporter [Succiniclasticum ruminis]SDC53899.1 Na+/H+-dicarboxylate symporter [Succiniclasticum ruminis]
MNLSVQILVALILSVCAGLVIGPEGLPFVNKWIAPIGTIFINFIKMMIVPVVTCSLIVGVTSLGGDSKKLGRISAKTICLYLITTAVAIVLGFAVAGIIQPGVGLDIAGKVAPKVKEAPTFMQVLVDMVPTNPVDAMAKGRILPVIIFALLVGIGITQLDEKRSRFLMDLYDAGAEVCYKIIAMVMKFAPLGVFALLLPVVCKNGPKVLLPLLSVILAVAIGCALQCILVYSTLASTMGGVNPVKFFRGMSEAMMLAFTTCSSAAALPVNMKNCQEKLGLSREVTSFVLPLGCTINMDGTALYMGVCSLFVANAFGVNLTTSDMIMIVFTGTLASIGTAGVPGAGLIMLAMVLQAVQLPMEGLALVAGIDRVLDMFRTCVNITGDGAVCCVVDKTERKHAA